MAVLLARFWLEVAFMPMRRSTLAVAARLLWVLTTRPISMLGLHQLYALTSLSTTQTRALPASSLMLRRVRLDSRLVHRVRAITKSRPRMALPEFVARSVAVCSTLRLMSATGQNSVIAVMSVARPLFHGKRKSIRDLAMSQECQNRS